MNATEIVKALRACDEDYPDCDVCYLAGQGGCYSALKSDAAALIEQQEAALKAYAPYEPHEYKSLKAIAETEAKGREVAEKAVKELVMEFAALKEAQRWIPILGRKPTEADADWRGHVMAWRIGCAMKIHWMEVRPENASHWMPLPAAPEKEAQL